MKHINHNPETEGEPLPEAMKAAIEALVVNLQANRVRDCLFVIAAFRGGVPNPMETVQIASNMTPELTNHFLSILGRGPDKEPQAANAPQIIVPGNGGRH